MVNTRLVIALEQLFKNYPFNLENDTLIVSAENGSVKVLEMGTEEDLEHLTIKVDELEDKVSELEGKITEYEFIMDANDICYDDF